MTIFLFYIMNFMEYLLLSFIASYRSAGREGWSRASVFMYPFTLFLNGSLGRSVFSVFSTLYVILHFFFAFWIWLFFLFIPRYYPWASSSIVLYFSFFPLLGTVQGCSSVFLLLRCTAEIPSFSGKKGSKFGFDGSCFPLYILH